MGDTKEAWVFDILSDPTGTSALYLRYISPVSPLHLPCISPASPQAQIVRAIVPERTLLFLFNVPEHVS